MITYVARCDYPECEERGPECTSPADALAGALGVGWQRWHNPSDDDELLDLCPAHHQREAEDPFLVDAATLWQCGGCGTRYNRAYPICPDCGAARVGGAP